MSEYEGNEEEIRREATRWNMSKHQARIHKRRRAGALLLLCADPESHLEPVPEISALPQVWRPARVSPGTPHPNFFFRASSEEGWKNGVKCCWWVAEWNEKAASVVLEEFDGSRKWESFE